MGTCPFSVSITGVSYLPYLPSHCATCGLHAAKSECPLLLHDGWTPTGISSLLKVSSFCFSPGVMSDVNDSRVSLQELINRHLITMAQIDHSENPGKRLWDFKVLSSWTRVKIISVLWVCLKFLRACLAPCALVFLFFFLAERRLSSTDVPSEVDSYHSLFPLEPVPPPNRMQKTSNFSYITSCYKAVNSKDDLPYCLRRIHGEKLPPNYDPFINKFIVAP